MKNLLLIMCLVVCSNCASTEIVNLSSKSNQSAILAPANYELILNDSFYDIAVERMLAKKFEQMGFKKGENPKFKIKYELNTELLAPFQSKTFYFDSMALTKSDLVFKHTLKLTFLSLDGKTKISEYLAYHLSNSPKFMLSLPNLIEATFSDYPKSYIEQDIRVRSYDIETLQNVFPSYY